MTNSDLTIKVLQGIREDLARTNHDTNQRLDAMRTDTNERLDAMRAESEAGRRESNQRFEVIETALRDVAEQLVMLSRAVKVAIEVRAGVEKRIDDHERRLAELEQRSH
ncbi:MAG: hypothetical protein Q8S33_37875 [Myxococcales bacterium]|nr:hypothetical protein [Myxococcales bacterium]